MFIGPINTVGTGERAMIAPVPDFATGANKESRPRPSHPSHIEKTRARNAHGESSNSEMTSSRARSSERVSAPRSNAIFVSELSESVTTVSQTVIISGESGFSETSVESTLELIETISGGENIGLQKALDTDFDTAGSDSFYEQATETFIGLLQTQGGTETFVDTISSLPTRDREKLSDLKAGACEKLGLGIWEGRLADEGLMETVRRCADNLSEVIIGENVDIASIRNAVQQYVSDVSKNFPADQSGSSNGIMEAASILGAAKLLADALSSKNRKKLIIVVGVLSLLISTCGSPTPEKYVVQADSIPAVQENFGNPVLKGEIVDILPEVDNINVLTQRAETALRNTGMVENGAIVAQTLKDKNGNRQSLIRGVALNEDGSFSPPVATPSGSPSVESPVMFLYAEADGFTKLVPPGTGVELAGGKMIPLTAWNEEGKYVIGMETPSTEGVKRIPVYTFSEDEDGNLAVILRDPFSGLDIVLAQEDNPLMGADIASIDPLFGYQDAMDASSQAEQLVVLSPREQAFKDLQEKGINVEHRVDNADLGWGLLINGEPVPEAYFDEDGKFLNISVGNEDFKISVELAADRLYMSEDGVLGFKDDKGSTVAAFGPQLTTETLAGKWFIESEVIGTSDSPIFMGDHIQDHIDFLHAEKVFLDPFPADTYYPEQSKIIQNYYDEKATDPANDFSWKTPFGKLALEDLDKSPFKTPVNYKVLKGPEGYMLILSEQVYDPFDPKHIQVLSLTGAGNFKTLEEIKKKAENFNYYQRNGYILLPTHYSMRKDYLSKYPWGKNILYFLKQQNFADSSDNVDQDKIWELVNKWFSSGSISPELEILLLGVTNAYIK